MSPDQVELQEACMDVFACNVMRPDASSLNFYLADYDYSNDM